jgi:UrcA family protein
MEFPMQTFFHARSILLAGLLLTQGGVALAQEASAPNERVSFDAPYTIRYSAASAGPGVHQADRLAVSRPVEYGDLDLNTAAGVDAFKGRVQQAARQVCRQIDMRSPASGAESRACVEAAAASALEKVRTIVASRTGTAQLAALH